MGYIRCLFSHILMLNTIFGGYRGGKSQLGHDIDQYIALFVYHARSDTVLYHYVL